MGEMLDSLMKAAEEEKNGNPPVSDPASISQPSTTGSASQKQPEKRPVQVVPNRVKKGNKISARSFLVGCMFFGIFFVIIFSIAIYYLITSPTLLKSIGLEIGTAVNLLKVFVFTFFGLIFFVSFFIAILNGYRINTVKEGKGKYIMGIALGVFLIFFSLGFGTVSIIQIGKLSGKAVIKTNNLINLYLQTKEGALLLPDQSIPVAPAYVKFELNKDIFRSQVMSKLTPDSNLTALSIDCGNGQQLSSSAQLLSSADSSFGECLFLQKKDYDMNLTYKYIKGGTEYEDTLSFGKMNVQSEISIRSLGGNYQLNDSKNEILVGDGPAKVLFDANKIFTDLGLNKNSIEWDFDSDGKVDSKDKARVQYTYETPQLYYVLFKLPMLAGYEDTTFGFKVRVGEADGAASCNITVNSKGGTSYSVIADIGDSSLEAKSYNFKLLDTKTDKVVDKVSLAQATTSFDISGRGTYKVTLEYILQDGKKGNCTSQAFETSSSNYKADYSVSGKGSISDDYSAISSSGGDVYDIPKYPYMLKLDISGITPMDNGDKIVFSVDGEEIIPESSSTNSFEFKVNDEKEYLGKIEVKADEKVKYTKNITFSVKSKPLVGILNVKPNIGKDPLEVELDASSSKVNEAGDEIVYFTWNFGDGEVYKKVTQGKVSHIYHFDPAKQNGEYDAQVTVTTKNGHEETISQKIVVQRQVQDLKIYVESPHTNQVARTLETVNYSIDIDGNIKSIVWDFGNGKTISGEGRDYTRASTTYDTVGSYTVKVIVEFTDQPSATATIKLRVID